MKAQTLHILRTVMAVPVGLAALMVLLFETGVLPCGLLAGRGGSGEFVAAMVMELLTLCAIPVALRLFRFSGVAATLKGGSGMLRWGTVRLLLLCVPLVANTLLYYIFMNVAFGYMGIILLLCLAFVAPTKARCEQETRG